MVELQNFLNAPRMPTVKQKYKRNALHSTHIITQGEFVNS